MCPSDHDVVIVGAGPAGSSAAIHCAQRGWRVALIESENFPRHRPGETLHPGVAPLLGQLGLGRAMEEAGFIRHSGIWITWSEEARFEAFGSDDGGPWFGYQAWRPTLDTMLLHRARELGVTVLQPCRALNLLIDQRRIRGLRTSHGELASRFVIDATGGGHWLARNFGVRIMKHSRPLIARYGYVAGECPARDAAPAIVGNRDGWTWTAQIQPRLYQWTRLFFDRWNVDRHAIPTELAALEPAEPVRGADVTWRALASPAGPGYFVTGDAAAVLDPCSSHGVLKAIMSGVMAAHCIENILRHGQEEESAASGYSRWLLDWFHHDVLRLRTLYSLLP
ncbi:MAG: FAD-dependent oxidoreductase [Acidobacteriota bacterium]|nr:FAD-dependent oxidoreductase [Acidobacteriota bacterium]